MVLSPRSGVIISAAPWVRVLRSPTGSDLLRAPDDPVLRYGASDLASSRRREGSDVVRGVAQASLLPPFFSRRVFQRNFVTYDGLTRNMISNINEFVRFPRISVHLMHYWLSSHTTGLSE